MGKVEPPVAIAPRPGLRAAVILAIAGAATSPAAAQDAAATAFIGVSVLPMTGTDPAPQRDRTVIVRGGRIAAFGPSGEVEVPADARRIAGEDRWLLPGLIDSHVHLFSSSDLDLYLANGVTTIVNLGGYGAADSVLSIRQAVRDGRLAGPTIYTSGNWLDGDPPARDVNTVVRTAAEGREAVERQHAAGYDLVKVYQQLSPAAYGAIVETARSLNMPVTGHVPAAVGAADVLASGQNKVEHAGGLLFIRSIGADASAAAMDSLARAVAAADVSVTPTLWMARLAFEQRQGPGAIAEIAARPEMRYLPPPRRTAWRDSNMFASFPRLPAARGRALHEAVRRFTLALARAGVPVHAGTDADVAGSVPGFSLHEELGELVAAGLSRYEALRSATSVPGAWLGRHISGSEPVGTIEPGRPADLLLVEGDPLDDLAVLRHPLGVMTRGRWHPAADLEARLGAAEPPDTSGLGRLRDAWTEAYEAGRAADMRNLYTENAVRMPYDAPAVEGRASIVAAYEASFRGRGATPRIELTAIDVIERDDVVVERGAYDERWLRPDGAVQYEEVGKYVSVARRGSDGAWRYAVSIFNRDASP